MKLYPIMINMEGRLAVVVGGGEVATRKIADLLDAGALVKVISPELTDEILTMQKESAERLEIIKREYQFGDLEGAALVFSATNDRAVNEHVFMEAEGRNIFINAVDDPENCSFYVPSIIRKGEFLCAISTSGASPSYAAKIRREIEKYIPADIEIVLERLKALRNILKDPQNFPELSSPERGKLLKAITSNDALLEEIKNCHDTDLVDFINRIRNSSHQI